MLRTPDGPWGGASFPTFSVPRSLRITGTPPLNALGYLRVMFTVDDIDDTLARLRPRDAELVGDVVEYENTQRPCYIFGPDGLPIGLVEEIG